MGMPRLYRQLLPNMRPPAAQILSALPRPGPNPLAGLHRPLLPNLQPLVVQLLQVLPVQPAIPALQQLLRFQLALTVVLPLQLRKSAVPWMTKPANAAAAKMPPSRA